jgi:hypothetical protein
MIEMSPEDFEQSSAVTRSEYLIHPFRVMYVSGGGWRCACREFLAANVCVHTREAAGRRAAQSQIRAGLATGRTLFGQRAMAGTDKRRPKQLPR